MSRTRRSRKRAEPSVPTDSVSDIAFLLIIFFILVTTLQQQLGFITELPSGERGQEKNEKTPIVQVKDGNITLNDQAVDIDELSRRLADLALAQKEGGQKVVLLEAAGNVEYQQYFDIMTRINAAGGVIGIVREEE